MEQFILILIIVSRWLAPKGHISRDELSTLLIGYLATASDIIDFFSILSEDRTLSFNRFFVYIVLLFWSISLIQFPFIRTAKIERIHLSKKELMRKYAEEPIERKSQKSQTRFQMFIESFKTVLETEIWSIFLVLFTQDGPFLVVRIISIVYYGIHTYSNYFFTTKNMLIIILQVYRIVVLCLEHRQNKFDEERRRKKFVLKILYKNSWPNAKKRQETDECFVDLFE